MNEKVYKHKDLDLDIYKERLSGYKAVSERRDIRDYSSDVKVCCVETFKYC